MAIFLVSSFQKSTKFRCQNAFENDIEKKGSKIEFGHRFGPPKTTKMAPKSDVERSLFRDAMGMVRTSAQIMENLLQPSAKRWAARQPHAAGKTATI